MRVLLWPLTAATPAGASRPRPVRRRWILTVAQAGPATRLRRDDEQTAGGRR